MLTGVEATRHWSVKGRALVQGVPPLCVCMEGYLRPTPSIDCASESIRAEALRLTREKGSPFEKARSLFYFSRDEIRYNPYASLDPLAASGTLERGYGFCVQKAALLAALARAAGIPARLGFVNIRNHRLDPQWKKIFGTDVVVFHGFAELSIGGRWLKATPAFDLRMCRENGFIPVEFDGIHHGMLYPRDRSGRPHIEYLEDHGRYADIPVEVIVGAVTRAYGTEFLECWKTGVWDYFLSGTSEVESGTR